MRKETLYRPSGAFIKADGIAIGRNDAELGGKEASLCNFELCARQQQLPDASTSIAPVNPEVVNPIVLGVVGQSN